MKIAVYVHPQDALVAGHNRTGWQVIEIDAATIPKEPWDSINFGVIATTSPPAGVPDLGADLYCGSFHPTDATPEALLAELASIQRDIEARAAGVPPYLIYGCAVTPVAPIQETVHQNRRTIMTKEATIPFGDANRTEENWQADVYRRLSRILSQPGGEKALTASMVAAAKEARRSRHATAPGRIPTDDKAGEEIETEPETKHNMAALPQRGKNKKPYWKYRVALKHLIPGGGSYRAIKASMDALANALAGEPRFREFDISRFRHIPRGNKAFDYLDYANNLLTEMYEYADAKRIWID